MTGAQIYRIVHLTELIGDAEARANRFHRQSWMADDGPARAHLAARADRLDRVVGRLWRLRAHAMSAALTRAQDTAWRACLIAQSERTCRVERARKRLQAHAA